MSPILYMIPLSPPSRAVLLTAKALDVELELKYVNMEKGGHKLPEYVKLNPAHTVPTLVDNEIIICDSHAINAYLVRKFGKDDSLYPKDFGKRALVDQILHFDSGVLFNHFRTIAASIFYYKTKNISPEQNKNVLQSYRLVEILLNHKKWMGGENVTIADFSLIPTVTTLNELIPVDPGLFPGISSWIKRAEAWDYYSANSAGLQDFRSVVEKCLSS